MVARSVNSPRFDGVNEDRRAHDTAAMSHSAEAIRGPRRQRKQRQLSISTKRRARIVSAWV